MPVLPPRLPDSFGSGPLAARDLVSELLHTGRVRVPGKGDVVVHDGRPVAHGQRLSWGESGEFGDREVLVGDTTERDAVGGLHIEHQDHARVAVHLPPVDENTERKHPERSSALRFRASLLRSGFGATPGKSGPTPSDSRLRSGLSCATRSLIFFFEPNTLPLPHTGAGVSV